MSAMTMSESRAHADGAPDAGDQPQGIEDRSPDPSSTRAKSQDGAGGPPGGSRLLAEPAHPAPREPLRELSEAAEKDGWPGFFSGVLALLRPKAPTIIREDITDALLNGGGDGVFSPEERTMLGNILRLKDVRVEDVMVPRSEIDAIEITATLGELMREFEDGGHSRMPVYGENLDDPKGMVHIRDVVAHITRSAEPLPTDLLPADLLPTDLLAGDPSPVGTRPDGQTIRGALDLRRIDLSRRIEDLDIVRKVLFVPPSMLATTLMAKMQASRTQMALVIDEYGGTDGLVSLEDIIEMVVGNIEDEHDDEEVLVVDRGEGVYIADARAELHEIRALVGSDFDVSRYEDEADTIGGLLFTALGRVPATGEVVAAPAGFELHVLDADPRRVRRVKIVRLRALEKRRRLTQGPAEPE